jgi:hypothetical protein
VFARNQFTRYSSRRLDAGSKRLPELPSQTPGQRATLTNRPDNECFMAVALRASYLRRSTRLQADVEEWRPNATSTRTTSDNSLRLTRNYARVGDVRLLASGDARKASAPWTRSRLNSDCLSPTRLNTSKHSGRRRWLIAGRTGCSCTTAWPAPRCSSSQRSFERRNAGCSSSNGSSANTSHLRHLHD